MFKTQRKDIAGNLTVMLGMMGYSAFYLHDAYSASRSLENLIFIGPLSVITIGLLLVELVLLLKKSPPAAPAKEKVPGNALIYKGMGAFAVFLLIMDTVGFDLATAFFVFAFMFIMGERRIWMLVGYSIVFAVLVTGFFSFMLPYPMPTLIPFEF